MSQWLYMERVFSYTVHSGMSGRLKSLSWNAELVTLIMDADNSADQEQIIENEKS